MELTLTQALQMGIDAHKAGRFKEADKYYTAILQVQPKHPDANHNMGLLVMGIGKEEESLSFFKVALNANPKIAQFWISYIKALIKLGLVDDAKAVLNEARRNGLNNDTLSQIKTELFSQNKKSTEADAVIAEVRPEPPNILDSLKLDQALKLAERKVDEGSNKEAESIYKDILNRFPQNKKAIEAITAFSEGRTEKNPRVKEPSKEQLQFLFNLYTQGRLQDTLRMSSKLLKTFPRSLNLHNISGSANMGLGQFEAAIDNFEEAIIIKPDYAEAYFNLGNTFQQQKEVNKAIKAYEKALSLKPAYVEAHNNLGGVLKEEGMLKEALVSFNKALSFKPDYTEALYNNANTLKELGKLEEAIKTFRKVLQLLPEYAEAHNDMGNALQKRGMLEQAVQAFEKAISIKPDYFEAFYNMGVAFQEHGKLDGALEAYKKALELKPDYVDVYCNMGIAFQEHGKLDGALEAYKTALELKPNCVAAFRYLGNVKQQQGNFKDAIEAYNKALSFEPDSAEIHNNIGSALQQKGELESAIKAYKKALSIKPDYSSAWANIFFAIQALKPQICRENDLVSYYPNLDPCRHPQIYKSILNYKLHSGTKDAERSFNQAIAALSSTKNSYIRNQTGYKTASDLDTILSDRVVALVHFGRSGTGLLHSLIDGHPEVSSLPSIYLSEYFDPAIWEKITADGWDEVVNNFMSIYEVLFDASSSYPVRGKSGKRIFNIGQKEGMTSVGNERNEVLRVDKKLFKKELGQLMSQHNLLDPFSFFKLINVAYNKSIQDHNNKALIFYHIHNPDDYAQLNFVKFVPEAEWILMVRDPIQSCESWVKSHFNQNDYLAVCSNIITMLFEVNNIIYYKKNSIGVRLEDLKQNPKATISALCKWMDIKETSGLYEMTAQGKKWWGDPSSPDYLVDGMDPFGQVSINRKVGSVFSENDQFILSTLFYPFRLRFGYVEEREEQFRNDLQLIKPKLNEMFDFEKIMADRLKLKKENFMKSGAYLYLRSGLIERWDTLVKEGTYPKMITPLKIN